MKVVKKSLEALEPLQVIEQVLGNQLTSLQQENELYFSEDQQVLERLESLPINYFDQQALSLLQKVHRHSILEFNSHTPKEQLRQRCHQFAESLHPSNVTESVLVIFEELYMNAMLDAPQEANKRNKQQKNHYQDGGKAKIVLACSENRLAISCSDPFGSLDFGKFMDRLHQVYRQGAGAVMKMQGAGGAGIGCSFIFEHCSSLFLGVIPQQQTVVSCLIPIGLNNRERAKIKKSLHFIRG